jgi:hypothetical protein
MRAVGLLLVLAFGAFADDKPEPDRWQVRLPDGKIVPFEPTGESVTLDTKYGSVTVPMKEVTRLEFGRRVSETDRKTISDALADVVGGTLRVREAAKETLLDMGLTAYPAVCRAIPTAAKEALPHLTQVADKLKKLIGDEDDEPKDCDVIVTADGSRLCGLLAGGLKAKLDGKEQVLTWKEAKAVAFGKLAADEKLEIVAAAGGSVYALLTTHFDKVVGVEVTGRVAGSVWGTGPYTADSDLAAAAVHAGVLKDGETAVIKIRMKGDLGAYGGGTQNGVTTGPWGAFQGCYEILGKRKKK